MIGQPVNLYWPSFVWGLLVLAGFVGWGHAIARVPALSRNGSEPAPEPDWGLLAGWGMALTLAVGGVLACASAASRSTLIAFVITGAIVWAVRLWRRGRKTPTVENWISAAAFFLLIAIWYAPAVAWPDFNPPDDVAIYIPFARRLLDSGTLIEPFSLRRLQSLGGQALLHAMTLCFGTENNANLLDWGLAQPISAGLLFGYLRQRRLPQSACIGFTALFLLMPVPRLNIMSQATGIVLFFTLFRTLLPATIPGRRQQFMLIALVTAGICSLRSSLYIPAFLIVTGALLLRFPERKRQALSDILLTYGFTALFLLPWMVLLYRSSQSFLYPVMRGTEQPSFNTYSAGLSWGETALFCARVLIDLNVLLLGAALLVTIAFFAGQLRRLTLLFVMAALFSGMALAISFTYADAPNIYRYMHPVLAACVMAACGLPVRELWALTPIRRRRIWIATMALIAPYLLACWNTSIQRLIARVSSLPVQLSAQAPFASPDEVSNYLQLQAAIPPQGRMLAVVGKPSLLNYQRPYIYNADCLAVCSLSPGMPFFRGPMALKRYLKSVSIDYVAFTDFELRQALYDRKRWIAQRRAPEAIWRSWAPYYLDMMDNLEQLARTESVRVYGAQRLIHLE